MTVPPSAGSRSIGEHQQLADAGRPPTEAISANAWRQPPLLVQAPQEGLKGNQFCLDLDHKRGPRCAMYREDIDGPSLAIARVGHLDRNLPLPQLDQSRSVTEEVRVILVQQALQVGTSPCRCEVRSNLENPEDRSHRPQAQHVQVPSLKPRHGDLGHPGGHGYVGLPQLPRSADRTRDGPYPLVVHPDTVTPADHRVFNRALPAVRDPVL